MNPAEFPYRVMPEDVRGAVQTDRETIARLLDDITAAVLQIGTCLERVEGELSPTLFSAWLYSEFLWTERIADGFVSAAVDVLRHGHRNEFQPDAALNLPRSPLSEAVAAQQLTKARTLLSAYKQLFRGEPGFADLARGWRYANLKDCPVRGYRQRRSRRCRRRTPVSDGDRGDEPAE